MLAINNENIFLLTMQDWKLLRLKLQKYMEKVKVAAVALARRETSTRLLLLQRRHTVWLKLSWDAKSFCFIFGILLKFYDLLYFLMTIR